MTYLLRLDVSYKIPNDKTEHTTFYNAKGDTEEDAIAAAETIMLKITNNKGYTDTTYRFTMCKVISERNVKPRLIFETVEDDPKIEI